MLRQPAPADLAEQLAAALRVRMGAKGVELRRSGREALRVALRTAAAHTGRDEVVLPAYTCWSVGAAAAAAGLRVRLVDVDERGAIDLVALATLPLERAACVVVCNLFGIAEPVEPVAAIAGPRGAWVVDDAAQSFGATASDGAAGGRGDLGVLSFGRGKPLQALGGGAVVWHDVAPQAECDEPVRPRPWRAWLHARAWNAALGPLVFAVLSAAPFLHVGETRFDPNFPRGPISGDALVLCAHALARCEARRECREREALALADALQARSRFVPIVPPPGTNGAFPRLALCAPDRDRRDAALQALARDGAALFYPATLDEIPALRQWLAAPPVIPGSRGLAERLFTLPAHGGLRGVRRERVLATLARLAPR
jgi:dTDP-4-amino-4,6-dideoxygalactose transaminase